MRIVAILLFSFTLFIQSSFQSTYAATSEDFSALDIDGNGKNEPLSDGLLILRYLFDLRGNALIDKAIGTEATRSTSAEIEIYLSGLSSTLDIDGNGDIEPLSDGLLILRYMFDFRGNALIDKAVAGNASRTTISAIETYIQSSLVAIVAEKNRDQGLTSVRNFIPDTPALDGIYPPMSDNGGPRWEYIKNQYNQWYYKQAPSSNNDIRGKGEGEAWRYDPMKTLVELCRRADLVGDEIPKVCEDAKDTIAEFFSLQYWGTKGEFPDCSGGITGITRGNAQVNKCDFKYGGHASALHYATEIYGQTPYTNEQKTMFKEYCFKMGWNGQNFTERNWGISLQCLIDLQKQNVDTSTERKYLIDNLYSLVIAGKVGAPIHGINQHEGTNFASDPQMFSPWMGSSFLIPALWEYWVFIEKDPIIADMIVQFGDALIKFGIVDPEKWAPDELWHWKTKENPTQWLTLYFSIPNDKPFNIDRQNSDGGFSDLHNPEAIFALNAAYFFSCNPSFKERSMAMNPYFNNASAAKHIDSISRVFLWQHRGSASTEWLLENAGCGDTKD